MGEGINYLVIGLTLGWLTLTLGLVLYQRMRKWWHNQRYGTSINYGVLLMEYGRKMTGTPDRQALGQLLVNELPGVLRVERAALLLPEAYQLVSMDTTDTIRLPVSHAAVRWVASGGEAQRSNRGRLHELVQQGRADLAWTQVWVPLMRGTDLRGMWLLGAREDNIQYAPEDLRWLTAVAREATAVLEATHYAEQERQTASEMRALYRQVVSAQEVERGRLTRELHDGLLQDLCAVTRDLKALAAQQETDQTPATDLTNLAALSGETVNALRAICNDLRPPLLQRDLISALKPLVEALDARSPAPVHLDIAIQENDLRLSQDVALAIFRITQEALHNAIQHADASEIAIRLTQYPDRLRLTVTDDGRGIAGGVEPARFVAQGHFGLAGMRERAAMIGAKLNVQTAADYGTVVVLELPRRPITLETL
jgi:signal transduction histidine kinase